MTSINIDDFPIEIDDDFLDKFLNSRIFTGATGLHRTFGTDCSTFCRSKTCTVPREPCKRKTDPCKSLSVQKFVHTGVNGRGLTVT